jgi:hypothetical protein
MVCDISGEIVASRPNYYIVTGENKEMVDKFMAKIVESRYFVPMYCGVRDVYYGHVMVRNRYMDIVFRYVDVKDVTSRNRGVIYVCEDVSSVEIHSQYLGTIYPHPLYIVKLGTTMFRGHQFIVEDMCNECLFITYLIHGVQKHDPRPSDMRDMSNHISLIGGESMYEMAVRHLYTRDDGTISEV